MSYKGYKKTQKVTKFSHSIKIWYCKRKKNLSPKIYPSSLSLEADWFVQYWTNDEKPRRLRVRVPKLSTHEARLFKSR